MDKKQKTYLFIAIGALVLITIIAVYFYLQGKKTVSIQYTPGELPGNPGSGTGTSASNNEIKVLAGKLYDDMNGLNLLGHNMEPYMDALILSDNDLIKLYNTFNTLYQAKTGQTLYEWIDNEKFYENDITDSLLLKMQKLNLK